MSLQIETIRSLPDLESIRSAWSELRERCPDATVFQSPSWLLSWARHFAPDRTGAIALRESGELVALVPFFAWNGRLLLAGTGPTDYCDGLFAPEHGGTAAAALTSLAVAAVEVGAACIDLQQLRAESPLLRAPAPHGWQDELRTGSTCPVAQLAGDSGVSVLSSQRRKKLRRVQRQLQAHPDYEIGTASAEELGTAAAETLERLHARRWTARGESGVLAEPLMHAFIRTVMSELSAAGLLRLQRLRVMKQTIAIVFAIRSGRAVFFYLGGFDPDWSRFSPGTLTVVAAMQAAAAEGASEFHFLRGAEAYKYHLGAHDRPTYRRVLTAPGGSCA